MLFFFSSLSSLAFPLTVSAFAYPRPTAHNGEIQFILRWIPGALTWLSIACDCAAQSERDVAIAGSSSARASVYVCVCVNRCGEVTREVGQLKLHNVYDSELFGRACAVRVACKTAGQLFCVNGCRPGVNGQYFQFIVYIAGGAGARTHTHTPAFPHNGYPKNRIIWMVLYSDATSRNQMLRYERCGIVCVCSIGEKLNSPPRRTREPPWNASKSGN